jgi:hypothetical protein
MQTQVFKVVSDHRGGCRISRAGSRDIHFRTLAAARTYCGGNADALKQIDAIDVPLPALMPAGTVMVPQQCQQQQAQAARAVDPIDAEIVRLEALHAVRAARLALQNYEQHAAQTADLFKVALRAAESRLAKIEGRK